MGLGDLAGSCGRLGPQFPGSQICDRLLPNLPAPTAPFGPEYGLTGRGSFSTVPPAMTGQIPRNLWVIPLLLVAVEQMGPSRDCVAAGPTTAETAVDGLLVLRNGNVLAGKVLRQQDHYRVEMPRGQLQVPAEQVEMLCQSLVEVYQRRRAVRTGSTADSHLDLARWCLRHDLLDYAARELHDARSVDPQHRRLSFLERQLLHARRLADQRSNPSPPTRVVPPQAEVEVASLERAPRWARVLFVRQIQPLLVASVQARPPQQQEELARERSWGRSVAGASAALSS